MKKRLDLGKEKISKLMLTFSIPCIISLLVNSLYNIVDQIFIGYGVGYLGNGATNVVFPLTILCLAFALMCGDGSSSYLSLKSGENKKDEASKGAGNGIAFSVILAILFCIIILLFLPQLLNLFGCTELLKEYALQYGFIIAIGLPFMMIGTTLNSIIRADGNPKYAMTSMIAGAVLNIILDPIFIFVFHMGVAGAAIATVISQILTFIMNVLYIKKFKTIKITKETLRLKLNIIKKVLALGISSFITQIDIVIVMAIQNNLLGKYGALTKFGAEIPITVLGIVMKVNQILNSVIIGISTGSQPIVGYNYGAGQYDRVKKALKLVLTYSVIISLIAFILFQTIPDKVILLFGNGDSNYIEFACMAFRIYLLLCVLNGIIIPTGIFLQSIGKSLKSAILSLSRKIILLIPSILILSNIYGLMGLLYAGPVADGISFIIATILLVTETTKLGKSNVIKGALIDDTSTDNKLSKHMVITISREYGSGGRYVGRLIADKLGIKFYDKELIIEAAKKTGLSEEFIENNEQKIDKLPEFNNGYYLGLNNSDKIFLNESEIIKKLANKESCVIVGRCADYVLQNRKDLIKVFIYSDPENKIKRATKFYSLTKEVAKKEINKINKLRASHYKYYTEKEWADSRNYDISLNSDWLGIEKTAEMICNLVLEKCNEKTELSKN